MKKFKWLLGMLVLALMPMLQSCDDDGYSIGDFSWDWATVRATGGGGYYLEGDRWYELKRNGRPERWCGHSGVKYVTAKFLYTFPIPKEDIALNSGLIQNPGYETY